MSDPVGPLDLKRPKTWQGSVLVRPGRKSLYIQIKHKGKWVRRSTRLRAVRENVPKAIEILEQVRTALLTGEMPKPTLEESLKKKLPRRGGSVYRRIHFKKFKPKSCEACGWEPPGDLKILNAHHVIHHADGGSDDASNLAVLCPNCHAVAHKVPKQTSRDALFAEIRRALGMPDVTVLGPTEDVAGTSPESTQRKDDVESP